MTATTTVYVVRDASGEYLARPATADRPERRTAASNEAREFETADEARAAISRATDRVLAREVSPE